MINEADPARHETDENPVRVLCDGSPRAMGRAQGAGMRETIREAGVLLRSLEAFRLRQPGWLPYPAYLRMAEGTARRFLGRALRERPAMRERLAGLAEGAGVRHGSACLFNAMEPLLSAVGGCTACPGACSAVAIRGTRSAIGEPVVARNFDYLPLVQPLYVLRECRPRGGLRSLEFTTAPLVGAVDGMNEAGLCVVYDYAFATDEPAAPAAPISMAIAEALAECRTTAEAAERIAATPRWGGGLLMLCDAGGDVASLELSSTRSRLRRPDAGEDALFHTNAYSDPHMRAVQIAADAVYTDAAPLPLRGRPLHQSSSRRDRRFRELLAGDDAFDADALAALMADHGPDDTPGDDTPCVHGSYWNTTACLQFFPRSRRVRVSYSHACRAEYHEVRL